VLTGSFSWAALPESLRIPSETGLVELSVRGEPLPFPDRDEGGRLWLRKRAGAGEAESRLEVVVHRRVVDEVPLLLEAVVQLRVSGQGREVAIGPAVPAPFAAMSLDSPLPARVESDGRLRVQVRPGTWTLRLLSRHQGGPVAAVALLDRDPDRDDPWDPEEVWVFDARNHLRLVHVEGVPGIDPQQTQLPEEWKRLPAYLMKPGSRMRLVEKRRGDEDPAPDRLTLERTWWLDFDGGGYTAHDRIGGAWSRSWRLEAAPPTVLGRVSIDGRDQFISRLDAEASAGVEVRQGRVDIEADSRLEGIRSVVPAVGWSHDFQKVSAQLNLPPAWRLFHASGVDDVRTTWVAGWSLLEIFLVLVSVMIVAQLYGRRWAGVALVTLVLIYPETGAPRWTWLLLLATHALLRVVPEGRLLRATRLARLGAIALLAVVAIPFVVQQARIALYPTLEFPWLSVRAEAEQAAAVPEATEEQVRGAGRLAERRIAPGGMDLSKGSAAGEPLRELRQSVEHYYAPDPLALVSTGPGLPRWAWRAVELGWRGPVEAGQEIRLLLIPPWGNFLLAWVRIAATVLLALCLLDLGGRLPWLRVLSRGTGVIALALLASGTFASSGAAADVPPQEILDELRARLLEPPECFPACAASPRMRLRVTPTRLRARIEIDAAWDTAVPLPGGVKHWMPETVLVDGIAPRGLAHRADGRLFIPLGPGKHQVTLEGPLPGRDTVQIPLPLKPRRVEADVSGWTLDGVGEDGRPDQSLQLTRERETGPDASTLEPQELPPFVRVERNIRLGLSWQVESRVTRMTPPGRALFLELPLLPGESVTREGLRVAEGRTLMIAMGPTTSSVSWTSVLDVAPSLQLRAADTLSWTEVWRLDVAPVWHVEATGIPVVHTPTPRAIRIREWRPWPGEDVDLRIVRPESVDGRTLTIDHARLHVRPGLRASESTLTLDLRASRGLQHALTLPEGAELESVKLDGALQPIRAVEGRIVLPIRPGKHTAELVWRSPDPIATRYRTAAVDPGVPSVNAEIEVGVPVDRWVLFVGGPRLGPAVLFWSLLIVALLLAWGLGKIPLTPLGWGSWFLLFIGLSQVTIWLSLLVVAWLLALGWRRANAAAASDAAFNALQLLLALSTAVALLVLVWAIQQGLLGLPDMQIAGNGSSSRLLRWYQDRTAGPLPTGWMVSLPLGAYRLAMLAWALWLARALVGWLRWGWDCFSRDGIWRPLRPRVVEPPSGP
jgi:hypothetical protein